MKKPFLILFVFTVFIIAACQEPKSPEEYVKEHVKTRLDSALNGLSAYESGSLGTVDSVIDRIETDSTISKTRDGVLETHDKATGILNSISGLIEEVTNSKEQ